MCHFEHKKWHYCESDFLMLETYVFIPIIDYWYFRNRAVNFIKICTKYANQWVIKVALSIINSDKLSRSYDDLYLGVIFEGKVYHTQIREHRRVLISLS